NEYDTTRAFRSCTERGMRPRPRRNSCRDGGKKNLTAITGRATARPLVWRSRIGEEQGERLVASLLIGPAAAVVPGTGTGRQAGGPAEWRNARHPAPGGQAERGPGREG